MKRKNVPIALSMCRKSFIQSFKAFLILPIFIGTSVWGEPAKVLNVSADSWMPFNGEPGSPMPGYVIEIMTEIFEPQGIKIAYTNMPYKEALEAAREQKIDAVIGANDTEGKGLIMPKQAIGSPSVCLLISAKSNFDYQSMRSLHKPGVNLGVIEEYSYWPALDDYIAKGKGIVLEKGDTPLSQLFKKLESGEVTVLAETEPVLLWYLRENKLPRNDFKAVYRHMADPIYVAFSNNAAGKEFSSKLDAGIKLLRSSGRLTKILAKYGLNDWE